MERILAVNMKAYDSAFGDRALGIARSAREISSTLSRVRIIIVAPLINASKLASVYEHVYAQHADPLGFGAYTGFTPVAAVKAEGIRGVMVNHSEHKVTYRDVQRVVEAARSEGLEALVCADTPQEASAMAYLGPNMIAIEPPELIGTGIPVSKAKPEVVISGVKAVKLVEPSIKVLAGAGISDPSDAVKALELGSEGILVASAIMKKGDPPKEMQRFALAMEEYEHPSTPTTY